MKVSTEEIIQGSHETDEQYRRRLYKIVDNKVHFLQKIKRNETAEDHYARIEDYQYSTDGQFIFNPRDGEVIDDPRLILRSSMFLAFKKKALDDWTKEIYSKTRKKAGQTLAEWLTDATNVIEAYKPIIYEYRVEFDEEYWEMEKRKDLFSNRLNEIKIQIRTETKNKEYEDKIKALDGKMKSVTEIEKAKLKARKDSAQEDEIKEQNRLDEEKKKKQKSMISKIIHIVLFAICIYFLVNNYYSWVDTPKLSKFIFGGMFIWTFYIWYKSKYQKW